MNQLLLWFQCRKHHVEPQQKLLLLIEAEKLMHKTLYICSCNNVPMYENKHSVCTRVCWGLLSLWGPAVSDVCWLKNHGQLLCVRWSDPDMSLSADQLLLFQLQSPFLHWTFLRWNIQPSLINNVLIDQHHQFTGVLSCGLKWWSWSTHTHTHKWALCVPWAVQPCVLADRHVCNCSHVAHFPQAHKGIRPDRSAQANRLINDCKATLLLLLFSLFFFYNSSASSFPCLLSSSPSLYSNKKKISDFVRDWYFLFISKFHLVLFSCVDDFLTAASVTTVWWPLLKHLYIFLFKFFCFHSDK